MPRYHTGQDSTPDHMLTELTKLTLASARKGLKAKSFSATELTRA